VRALSGELLLAAWEEGAAGHELRRPLVMLSAALPDADPRQLGALPIAELNLLLLRLHGLSFGSQLRVFGTCPGCAARLEFTVPVAELAAQAERQAGIRPGGAAADEPAAGDTVGQAQDPVARARDQAGPVAWTQDGRRYRLRPVTTDDLLATLAVPDLTAARDLLLSRCLETVQVPDPGRPVPERPVPDPAVLEPDVQDPAVPELALREPAAPESAAPELSAAGPEAVPAEALRRFDEMHAAAELTCAVECPGCGARELLDFDIARFLWAEVRAAARRLLAEVHELASAYGWSERDITTMSPARRYAYLEMIGE
jgi:hypothetical protein